MRVSSPEKNNTLELGGKIKLFNGAAQLTGALFDTRVYNARISDPDDPTVQQAPFDQQVKGVELGINGYITDIWEVTANYTHLDDKITATSDPLSLGKVRAQYAARCHQCLEHAGTHPGVDDRRRLHRRQPSLRGYRKYRRRAGVRGIQCDDLVLGQPAFQAAAELEQRDRQAVFHQHLLRGYRRESRAAGGGPHAHRHRELSLLNDATP